MKKFEVISHTADLGQRVFGGDLKELFSNAREAMMGLMAEGPIKAASQDTVEIKLSALSPEELLVSWLSEWLYKFTVEHWLGVNTEILFLGKKEDKVFLRARAKGQRINYNTIRLKRELKAVTYHNLNIKKTEEGYSAEIIFDV